MQIFLLKCKYALEVLIKDYTSVQTLHLMNIMYCIQMTYSEVSNTEKFWDIDLVQFGLLRLQDKFISIIETAALFT